MNLVFTGSRNWPEDDPEMIKLITDRAFWEIDDEEPYDVYVGDAKGVDKLVRKELAFLEKHRHAGLPTANVHLHVFEADWDKYGRAAGMIRNKAMVEAAHPIDVVYAFHSSNTAFENRRSGTHNCARTALATGPGVRLYHVVRQP